MEEKTKRRRRRFAIGDRVWFQVSAGRKRFAGIVRDVREKSYLIVTECGFFDAPVPPAEFSLSGSRFKVLPVVRGRLKTTDFDRGSV